MPALLLPAQGLRRSSSRRRGLTLVEMLVAMSVTLLIMAAVVTVFANVTGSVTNRRATIEMSSALRNVREALARDLAGATCPTIPWRRPEANEGYLEIIEGPQNDYYPSPWLWDGDDAGSLPDPITTAPDATPGIDLTLSSLPGSNLRGAGVSLDEEGAGLVIGSHAALPDQAPTDGRGLGDADDVLMLTVRNEKQPFVGRIPNRDPGDGPTPANVNFLAWANQWEQVESPLAEVVWFAMESPVARRTQQTFAFGEAGYRTIYRRALLILPELDYGITVDGEVAGPGVVRVLPDNIDRDEVALALAALIAFQDRFDLSVRLEWDPLLGDADPPGRWTLRANTLGDLTKRENRYEHHGFVPEPVSLLPPAENPNASAPDRYFPYAVVSGGLHSGPATRALSIFTDPQIGSPSASANFRALSPTFAIGPDTGSASAVVAYEPDPADTGLLNPDRWHEFRPLVVVNDETDTPATARAVLNEDGAIVHVTRGLAPLGGDRRGEDIMMTDALAFDVRVYDPGAPIYAYYPRGVANEPPDAVVQPGDPAWDLAFHRDAALGGVYNEATTVPLPALSPPPQQPPTNASYPFTYERQGAYVDLGYGRTFFDRSGNSIDLALMPNRYAPATMSAWPRDEVVPPIEPRFGIAFSLTDLRDGAIRLPNASIPIRRTSLYAIYDTWSWHYETNGVNEDADDTNAELIVNTGGVPAVDEGVNELDDAAVYDLDNDGFNERRVAYGPDDPDERETRPPYASALRGMQVTLRTYERDSRQIREVNVRESFVPE